MSLSECSEKQAHGEDYHQRKFNGGSQNINLFTHSLRVHVMMRQININHGFLYTHMHVMIDETMTRCM